MAEARSIPFLKKTPAAWAPQALAQPLEILSDQAYLEKKAANNALEFLNLWPGPQAPDHWLASIAAIARDETQHLQLALRLLEKKGGKLARSHKNPYATDLRTLVRRGRGSEELADRLLVSGLIEARSCERFERLAEAAPDPELARFYAGLVASENGHYRLFLDMAGKVTAPAKVEKRWRELAEAEAGVIQAQAPGPRIHSGWN